MKTDEVLFVSNDIAIYDYQDYLVFAYNDASYQLMSNPHEPCLYIYKDNKIIRIIHNSFTIDEIADVAKTEHTISSVTGKQYDIYDVCTVLSCAVNISIYETDLGYLEKYITGGERVNNNTKTSAIFEQPKVALDSLDTSHIVELLNDPFYFEYKKYDEAVLDFCILQMNTKEHAQKEHQSAVIFAMQRWQAKLKQEYEIEIVYHPEQMSGELINSRDFFDTSSKNQGKEKSYMELFLNPPSGSSYTLNDFNLLNNVLFPNGIENLEIYNWSTNWSNYFDDGLEWWGARCVSIYDKTLNRFVIIGASATD